MVIILFSCVICFCVHSFIVHSFNVHFIMVNSRIPLQARMFFIVIHEGPCAFARSGGGLIFVSS